MNSYAAFIGHQPHISIAELSASVPDFVLDQVLGNAIVLFTSSEDIDHKRFDMLGGTITLAKRISDVKMSLEDVPQMVVNETADVRGKTVFALRTHGLAPIKIHDLYRRSKDALKRKGKPSRYVGSERAAAAPVLLRDAGLLDGKHGAEIAVIVWKENVWIGRTVAAQDVDSYVKRDMKKPVRDTKTGLLPPKLAQVLLNFGQWMHLSEFSDVEREKARKKPIVVLDPFCGTGVIPMECMLRDWTVLASDKSERAVKGTTKNIEWIRKEYKVLKKDVISQVWKQDATKPFEIKLKPDVIVTETSLGAPLEKRASIKDAMREMHENERLQIAFIHNVAKSLPDTPIVCTWPVWYVSSGQVRLEKTWEALHEAGYQAILPPGVEPDSNRVSLLYRRPDQYVGREIVLLRPRKK